ncbi:MAG TPA: UDP-N-acetylenolpyruvoylglucosamine reductase, partial [Paludibacteraceae bacterium]|nr:UDP-N-acetylenolpyruvoylglucosamine reductase [Paludibacteraceae bacterium]
MSIQQNLSLKSYNTFGIDVNTRYFAEYSSIGELKEILGSEIINANPWLHIGGGSNLLFLKDFEGIILHSQLKSI